jgi:hypothetical protein
MVVPLPNLDDRRWLDLVEEGRSLIPFYAPEWTDHNIHDPGITTLELLAWVAEMDIYRLNRVPLAHRLKFLALVGVSPLPPRPARTVLRLAWRDGAAPFELPAGVEFEGTDLRGERTRFRTLDAVTLVANRLEAVQTVERGEFRDLTQRSGRGEEIEPFGSDPSHGAALYLGFRDPLPVGEPCLLFFSSGDRLASAEEEARLREEMALTEAACRPGHTSECCPEEAGHGGGATTDEAGERQPLAHHSVRTVWEALTDRGFWRRLEPSEGEVRDETRAFTLSGRVVLRVPQPLVRAKLGASERELFYVRCRLLAGTYDAAPALQHVLLNAVEAEQAVSFGTRLTIAPGVVAKTEPGVPPPAAGQMSSFILELDERGEITSLRFVEPGQGRPAFRLLEYTAASATTPGVISFEADFLGVAEGGPLGRVGLAQQPVVGASFRLFTLEGAEWREWMLRADLDASGRDAAHFTLDGTDGFVNFGDGERGRLPAPGALSFATGDATRAERGNLQRGAITKLTDSPHNRAVLENFDAFKAGLADVTNPLAGAGGSAAETFEETTRRALELMARQERAVTLEDYEELARRAPGVRLARAAARANVHPQFPCYAAPGIVTVIVLPSLPVRRPVPSRALRQAVESFLTRRRVIGTRVVVTGPTYREVSVRASVQSRPGVDVDALGARLAQALDRFLHPLTGGPDAAGWPFGRDVYRSEILQLLDETPGVENVLSLELVSDGGQPQCGNLCVGPLGLVAAGPHEIEVV